MKGCTTNLWVKRLPRSATFPEIFPAIAKDAASQSNDAVCSLNRPMHARLFESLPNNGAATRFDDS